MVLVVLGIDALDYDLVDSVSHPNLTLADAKAINTIVSHTGEPSTHELWPTIITGLEPKDHGLTLDDGVAWGNSLIELGSSIADYTLPDSVQSRIGAWLLTNADTDAFRTPATYYTKHDLTTVFDNHKSRAVGVPNYVVDVDNEDREHMLRRTLGELFERNKSAPGGHTSSDPYEFYEQCMEMTMIRTVRARRALRGRQYELVFAYTSGLDLIGHVTYNLPSLQQAAYDEFNDFVGELRDDLRDGDELLLVSDHGLQEGVHTHEAMIASTKPELIADIDSVLDIRAAIENELSAGVHETEQRRGDLNADGAEAVQTQLEDLGYM